MTMAIFVQSGYSIIDVTDSTISAEHEGGYTKTATGNTMYGASPIEISIKEYRLTVSAGFEGITKAKKFLIFLLGGPALFLGVVFWVLFAFLFEETWPMYMGVAIGVGVPLIQLPIHLYVTDLAIPIAFCGSPEHSTDFL